MPTGDKKERGKEGEEQKEREGGRETVVSTTGFQSTPVLRLVLTGNTESVFSHVANFPPTPC